MHPSEQAAHTLHAAAAAAVVVVVVAADVRSVMVVRLVVVVPNRGVVTRLHTAVSSSSTCSR